MRTIPLVSKLLDRVAEDHPARARIERAGELLTKSLKTLATQAATVDAQARRETARRLRLILDAVTKGRPLPEIERLYAALRRDCYSYTPWVELNAALEVIFGEESLERVKLAAAAAVRPKRRRESPPPAASWRKSKKRPQI